MASAARTEKWLRRGCMIYPPSRWQRPHLYSFALIFFNLRFILPWHACRRHANIILAARCPASGSYKNWPPQKWAFGGGGTLFHFPLLTLWLSEIEKGPLEMAVIMTSVLASRYMLTFIHPSFRWRPFLPTHMWPRRDSLSFFFSKLRPRWASGDRAKGQRQLLKQSSQQGLGGTISWERRVTVAVLKSHCSPDKTPIINN